MNPLTSYSASPSLPVHSPRSLRLVLGCIGLLFATCTLVHAAPPPELTVLRTQYEKLLAERVTSPFDAALGALNTKFTAALDNAIAEAKKAGSLPAVLAIEADKKRIAEKLPLPDEDDDRTPDSLKKLRAIYREQFKKLDDQRLANHQTILPAYIAKLQGLETTLTKSDRVDEAKEVMSYREGLAVGAVAAAPVPSGLAAPNAKATSGPPVDAGPKLSAEEASRQLVEWAVRNGHRATIHIAKENRVIKTAQDIPQEKFDLIKIESEGEPREAPPWRLFQFTPNVDRLYIGLWDKIELKPTDVAMLGRLKQLKSLEFKGKVDDVHALAVAMPPLPSLTELIMAVSVGGDELGILSDRYPELRGLAFVIRSGMSDKEFTALEPFKHVSRLRLDWLKEPLTPAKARTITKVKAVSELGFMFPSVSPLDPATAAELPNIKSAQVHYRLPAGTIEGFKGMPSLTSLFFRNFDGFSEDDLKSLTADSKLTALNLDGISKLDDASLTRILAALNGLEELRIVNCAAITDASLSPLAGLKKLSKLTLGKNPGLTDAILASCKPLKKLKELSVKETSFSEAALADFKKAHPGVTVTK